MIREQGESVTLLFSNRSQDDRSTPDSITADDAPLTTDSKMVIYAKVSWVDKAVSYTEAGRSKELKATVSANVQYQNVMQNCYAVKLSDGLILTKTDEKLNDTRTEFTIIVAGTAGGQN